MDYAGLKFESRDRLIESEYSLLNEGKTAALFTTGNGYMGVRASLEEYASLGIQGFLIRGVMDEVVEVRLTSCDNMYMKKYYVDEERSKSFEKEERAINLLDFLLIHFEINGETFYPWEGKLISWKRWLDISDGTLHREVIWENSKGEQTALSFERFASFDNDHVYCMKASAEPLNYEGTIRITSGLDLRTKSNGQYPQRKLESGFSGSSLWQEELVGETYGFHAICGVSHRTYESGAGKAGKVGGGFIIIGENQNCDEGGFVTQSAEFNARQGRRYTLEKFIAVVTSRDVESLEETALRSKTEGYMKPYLDEYWQRFEGDSYAAEYERHKEIYQSLMGRLDIAIEGDETADNAIHFSNYHSLISLERNDWVHSFSAKGLTGETYNNFVWWDAEIFQAPVFQQALPEYAKNELLFRYSHLKEAKELAAEQGYKGARFPFTAGVTGKETVWCDVRHPFMQVHCVSDVALSVLNYFACTGDKDFMNDYGMELLTEICRYWDSRVKWDEKRQLWGIYHVTGTDEHHPYVDNAAYTNYSVYRVLTETVRLLDEYGWKTDVSGEEKAEFLDVAGKLYLPMDDTGMIPQFDDYFTLSRELEVQGGSKSGYTQMKQAGLYNLSQVIKQPDVLMLFAYQDLPVTRSVYSRNLDYYQARCEAASSLSYCVHSICFADMDMPESAYGYLMETAEMDLKDIHGGTVDGIHSGCAAGAWMAVVRGIAGMHMREDGVVFDPHFIPWWKSVSFGCVWHGLRYRVLVTNHKLSVMADQDNHSDLPLCICGEKSVLSAGNLTEYIF